MNLGVLFIVCILLAFFLYSGVKNLQDSKSASETSIPSKKYLTFTGGMNIALAALIILISFQTFRKYGDIDYFFRVIHGAVSSH